jgi:uncharacterized protein YfaS (alpha-2-macroglobulin family)
LDGILGPIAGGAYNTFSSALSIMALEAYTKVASEPGAATRTVHQVLQGTKQPLTLSAGMLPHVGFAPDAIQLVFGSRGDFGSYWSFVQSGFDLQPAKKALSEKMEIVRELVGDDGKPITKILLGDEVKVRIRARSLGDYLYNVAIVDLLPAGFEVVVQMPEPAESEAEEAASEEPSSEGESGGGEGEGESEGEGEGEASADNEGEDNPSETGGGAAPGMLTIALPDSTFSPEYLDVREDRVVLYGSLTNEMTTFLYKIKATNSGKVVVPAIHAESMYDRSVRARGEPGSVSVGRP